jgi:hypothetical protein
LARLDYRPSRVWLEAFVTATYDRLPSFPPQELSNLLWSLARMGWAPPVRYWSRALECARRAFKAANAQDIGVMAYSGGGGITGLEHLGPLLA